MTIPTASYQGAGLNWTEPMTTDALIDLFDFGSASEDDLDALLAEMNVGEQYRMLTEDFDGNKWFMTLRRES